MEIPRPTRLLNATQVADLYGISKSTVWKYRRLGKLPEPVLFGGKAKWYEDVIIDHLRSLSRVETD